MFLERFVRSAFLSPFELLVGLCEGTHDLSVSVDIKIRFNLGNDRYELVIGRVVR